MDTGDQTETSNKHVDEPIDDFRLPIENGITNNRLRFEETDDFGAVLRTLRLNHGIPLTKLAKQIGIHPSDISKIERMEKELPSEAVLRRWLEKLGCKENKKHLLQLAAQHKMSHTVKLYHKDTSNADMIRIIEAYKDKSLTPLDRALLAIVARD